MSTLSRLQALKEQNNTSMVSADAVNIPTPLWAYIEICIKAKREVSLNYMEGAKCLEAWLTTPVMPLEVQPVAKVSLSKLVNSYELEALISITSRYKDLIPKIGVDAALKVAELYRSNALNYVLRKAGYVPLSEHATRNGNE
jgi:hypothetical protein